MDIKTRFLGLDLNSPVIVGSSDLSASLANIEKMEESGAGAVVLKSILEEEILYSAGMKSSSMGFYGVSGSNYDFVREHIPAQGTRKYLEHIRSIKERFAIPVIASVNCCAFGGWVNFVQGLKDAGCDAVELNIFNLPCDMNMSYDDVDRLYADTLLALGRIRNLPVVVKMENYFTDLAKFVQRLSMYGISAVTLFNGIPGFDIDTDGKKIINRQAPMQSGDPSLPLMWTALLSKRISCDISVSGGITTSDDVIKAMLAGAATVQTVSALYRHGIEYIGELNSEIRRWMEKNQYESLEDFRGMLAIKTNSEARQFTRIQFIKTIANIH